MRKKLLTLLLAVAASVGMMFAEKVKIGDLYYNLDATNQTAEVTSSSDRYSGDIIIPSSVTVTYNSVSYSVTSIGEVAFQSCYGLTSVTIPNSVTSIGESAFQNCKSLTSVTIPNNVTSIGNSAFYNCSNLTSVTIPNSVTSIGEYAFAYCTGLTSIEIPNSVTSIGKSAFYGCSSLTSITIPNSVTSIGEWAFGGCSGLTSIEIPYSVTSIGEYAFSGCSGLTSIIVENGNSFYDSRDNCNAIIETATNTLIAGCKNTTIPNSVTSIGNYAFRDCTGLTSIEIPNNVTSIGDEAFLGCTGLTSVTIPNSVTSIGNDAFSGCTGLTSIIIENGNTIYDSRDNCNAIIETATNTLIAGCKNTIIPNSVTSIGYAAFYGCSGLTSIEIPNSVTSIGEWAFGGCSGLTSIEIPYSVTSIGEVAFIACTGLTSITIPYSVTSIGYHAFDMCSGLTSVTIPNSVTSIGMGAFDRCSGLTSVTIPTSVTRIGNDAFSGCTGLTSITCEAVNPPTCGDNVYYAVSRSIPLYVPANSINAYKTTSPWREWGDNIKPIQAEEAEVTAPHATPTENSVVLDWPIANDAVGYTIYIKKGDLTICTLSFNALGQLLTIAFAAPARNGNNHKTPTALQTTIGWQYTIGGLDPCTEYSYIVIAKRSDESEAYNETVPFKTTGIATSLNQTSQEPIANSQKLLINGQIFILRGEKVYTLQGQEVK